VCDAVACTRCIAACSLSATRPGARTLKRIVATIHNEPPITRSHLEALMRDLCDQHGLPRPEVNSMVEGEEVDFFWRAQRLIVETDGHATHGTNVAFERDRARDARLTLLGYRVVRFTYQQLTYERDHVAATLRGLLSAA
jgi:very-short-patch-repair endonuclease